MKRNKTALNDAMVSRFCDFVLFSPLSHYVPQSLKLVNNFDEENRIRRRVSGDGNSTLIVGSDGSGSAVKSGKYFELSI